LMRWIDLERRCCPFLRFVVEIEPDHGPTWLRLTGGPGVKDFPRAEVNPKCSEINWEPSGPSDGY
jgi:hypothetical protein